MASALASSPAQALGPVRIRRAVPDDAERYPQVLGPLPPQLAWALDEGGLSTSLDAAAAGPQRFHETLAAAHAKGYNAALSSVSAALIALAPDGEPLGSLVATPAVRAFRQPYTFHGHTQLERLSLIFAAEVLRMTVPESSRTGAALLHSAADLYSRAGYGVLFGAVSSDVEAPLPAPFSTIAAGKVLCLDPAFLGHSVGLALVHPDPDTRIYYTSLQEEPQTGWEYEVPKGADGP
ncbi:hypothetical protein [Sinomonas terrae]|uniref:N-acetyltransferase domain-containing protein n=1 Tax=Sinomonas terrae TaxID=2908838 RepID=A0ABS9U0E0_9MICC|nr:hypothetical protein [Sinomonas terrae]MCH6470146.1 hypothetical protein [Sinomonas terrae]